MRRSHRDNYTDYQNLSSQPEEDDQLTSELKDKIKTLKSITIDIGKEVKNQNLLLNNMGNNFGSSEGLLERSMKRLGILSKGSHNYYMLFLFLFCFFVFFLLWLILKFR